MADMTLWSPIHTQHDGEMDQHPSQLEKACSAGCEYRRDHRLERCSKQLCNSVQTCPCNRKMKWDHGAVAQTMLHI